MFVKKEKKAEAPPQSSEAETFPRMVHFKPYAAALAKLEDIRSKKAEVERKLESSHNRGGGGDQLAAQARELLAGKTIDLSAADKAQREFGQLKGYKAVLDLAEKYAAEALEAQRVEASVYIGQQLAERHKALAIEQARLAVALSLATFQEMSWHNEISREGARDCLLPVYFLPPEDLHTPGSGHLFLFLVELAEQGFLTGDEDFLSHPLIQGGAVPWMKRKARQRAGLPEPEGKQVVPIELENPDVAAMRRRKEKLDSGN
jgi:hypothetical protein